MHCVISGRRLPKNPRMFALLAEGPLEEKFRGCKNRFTNSLPNFPPRPPPLETSARDRRLGGTLQLKLLLEIGASRR